MRRQAVSVLLLYRSRSGLALAWSPRQVRQPSVNCCTISALNTCSTRDRQASRTTYFGSLRVAASTSCSTPLPATSIEPSFRAIADGGRFVEIGKRGIKSKAWVDALNRGTRYDVVDWGENC